MDQLFVAAGLNSIGILTGGGVGRMLAHWIINGEPDMDVTGVHPDRSGPPAVYQLRISCVWIGRFQPYQATPAYRGGRVVESLGKVNT